MLSLVQVVPAEWLLASVTQIKFCQSIWLACLLCPLTALATRCQVVIVSCVEGRAILKSDWCTRSMERCCVGSFSSKSMG